MNYGKVDSCHFISFSLTRMSPRNVHIRYFGHEQTTKHSIMCHFLDHSVRITILSPPRFAHSFTFYIVIPSTISSLIILIFYYRKSLVVYTRFTTLSPLSGLFYQTNNHVTPIQNYASLSSIETWADCFLFDIICFIVFVGDCFPIGARKGWIIMIMAKYKLVFWLWHPFQLLANQSKGGGFKYHINAIYVVLFSYRWNQTRWHHFTWNSTLRCGLVGSVMRWISVY